MDLNCNSWNVQFEALVNNIIIFLLREGKKEWKLLVQLGDSKLLKKDLSQWSWLMLTLSQISDVHNLCWHLLITLVLFRTTFWILCHFYMLFPNSWTDRNTITVNNFFGLRFCRISLQDTHTYISTTSLKAASQGQLYFTFTHSC